MSIVVKTDFRGEYNISKNCYDQLDFFIEKYENYYLVRLLGAELYTLFIADLTVTNPQIPQTSRFLNIFNLFNIDDNNCIVISEGIREMLVQLIYFHYVRESQVINTAGGTVSNSVELGLNASFMGNIVQVYNQGVNNSHSIQWYICDNLNVYPEENIQILQNTSGI
tara:strand:+ start:1640 stop:2140 length:501 start_codon:yes stop_codon:yes gene_type:complete